MATGFVLSENAIFTGTFPFPLLKDAAFSLLETRYACGDGRP